MKMTMPNPGEMCIGLAGWRGRTRPTCLRRRAGAECVDRYPMTCAWLVHSAEYRYVKAYAEILALATQQAQSDARPAISSPLLKFDRSEMSLRMLSLILLMHLIWSLREARVVCRTLPMSQEHRFGALFGAGQKGIGSCALGHTAKYCWMKSWYSQE